MNGCRDRDRRRPVVLTGANGAGKTNLLGSRLSACPRTRPAPRPHLAISTGDGDRLAGGLVGGGARREPWRPDYQRKSGPAACRQTMAASGASSGSTASRRPNQAALGDLVAVLWLTPVDGPAVSRRGAASGGASSTGSCSPMIRPMSAASPAIIKALEGARPSAQNVRPAGPVTWLDALRNPRGRSAP